MIVSIRVSKVGFSMIPSYSMLSRFQKCSPADRLARESNQAGRQPAHTQMAGPLRLGDHALAATVLDWERRGIRAIYSVQSLDHPFR